MANETPVPRYWIGKHVEFVAAYNVPEWLALIQRPKPTNGTEDTEAATRQHAEFLHRRELQALIDRGELTLRDGVSRHPVAPRCPTIMDQLSIDDALRFCARAGVIIGRGEPPDDGARAAERISATPRGSAAWTDSEKAEMRKDRVNSMTEQEIGEKWGITRQRLAELIGKKTANVAARKT